MSKKEIVGTFLGAVATQDTSTMREVANADYIQHNPFVPTGLEPFIGLLPVLKEHGTYAENVRMFEDGNYVFMHNIWKNATPFGADEMVAFDIIRVDDNGTDLFHGLNYYFAYYNDKRRHQSINDEFPQDWYYQSIKKLV